MGCMNPGINSQGGRQVQYHHWTESYRRKLVTAGIGKAAYRGVA